MHRVTLFFDLVLRVITNFIIVVSLFPSHGLLSVVIAISMSFLLETCYFFDHGNVSKINVVSDIIGVAVGLYLISTGIVHG